MRAGPNEDVLKNNKGNKNDDKNYPRISILILDYT